MQECGGIRLGRNAERGEYRPSAVEKGTIGIELHGACGDSDAQIVVKAITKISADS